MADSIARRAGGRLAVLSLSFVAFTAAVAGAAAAASFEDRVAQCAACHGEKGRSPNPDVPSIGGQPRLFVMYQLFFYREGRRKNPEMNTIAKEMSDADLQKISDYVSKLPPPPPLDDKVDEARYLRAAALAQKRLCASCHNPDYSGRDQMARLAGQHESYTLKALKDFQAGARVGTQAAMAEAVRGLTEQDLADLAYYFARFR